MKTLAAGLYGLLFLYSLIARSHAGVPVVFGEHTSVHSEILPQERSLLVRLADSYENAGDRRCPVIFAIDDETIFIC